MFIEVNDEMLLWRYLSLEKFEMLLASRSLYCPKASKFEDPWEGRLPKSEDEALMKEMVSELNGMGAFEDKTPAEVDDAIALFRKSDLSFDRNRLISCWHMNMGESAAMWDLYCSRDKGLAVVTTGHEMKKLAAQHHDKQAVFAAVEYLDYQTELVKGAGRDPAFCKRLSFEHEREARLVCSPQPEAVSKTGFSLKSSISLPIDLSSFLTAIYVSPASSTEFEASIEKSIHEAGLDMTITKSDLYTPY